MRKRNGKLAKPYDSLGLAFIETKELEFGHFHYTEPCRNTMVPQEKLLGNLCET